MRKRMSIIMMRKAMLILINIVDNLNIMNVVVCNIREISNIEISNWQNRMWA